MDGGKSLALGVMLLVSSAAHGQHSLRHEGRGTPRGLAPGGGAATRRTSWFGTPAQTAPSPTTTNPVLGKSFVNSIGMEFVWIPPGSFVMGSPENEAGHGKDEAPHRVSLAKGFWLGRYEVTQAQWRSVMEHNPSFFEGLRRPVEAVSWNDCQSFCRKLSAREGRHYRLPAESEWEYACRAGTTTPFSFGATVDPAQVNHDGTCPYGGTAVGQYREQTVDVGSFPANAFGLHDMHGNVWEWCEDEWHDTYDGAPDDGRAWTTGEPSHRVVRGGSWFSTATGCRSASRLWHDERYRNFGNGGLRIVLPIEGAP